MIVGGGCRILGGRWVRVGTVVCGISGAGIFGKNLVYVASGF